MRLYHIAQDLVHSVLMNPDFLTDGSFGARHAWKQLESGGFLRVTFKDEPDRRLIITVTPKRSRPGDQHAN